MFGFSLYGPLWINLKKEFKDTVMDKDINLKEVAKHSGADNTVVEHLLRMLKAMAQS